MFFMKKSNMFACMMALAIAGTAGLTSCKSNEPEGPGEYNGEVVKTEFSISLPNQLSNGQPTAGPLRMQGDAIQKNGMSQFQGMTGITLIPFAKQGAIDLASDTRLGTTNITLPDFTALGTNSYAQVYENVSIPLTTASFLFYAKSKKDNSDEANKFAAGSLIAMTNTNPTVWATDAPANLTFNLEPISADYVNSLLAEATGGKLLAYLSSVACASDGLGTPKHWYEYTAGDDAAIKAMFDTYTLISNESKSTGLKYLSSFGVSRVLTDLYRSLKPLSTPIANGIKTAINNATYIDATELASNDTVVLISALQNYPGEINLPDGSISIKWDGTNHEFIEGIYPNMTHPEFFTYPAQLWYYVNSQIKTSNTSKKTMYDNSNDWTAILNAHTDAIAVNTMTRAVAIEQKIEYAVARFDVTVKLASGSMADNSESAEGKATPVNVSGGFDIKGVFIGGQQKVRYDFTRTGLPNGDQEYTIYDRDLAKATWKATTTAPTANDINHTLVLENGTSNVRIAIEMVNNGKDFYGYDNQLIPHNGKFYVCAELVAANASETGGHVFKQDYVTTANLTLVNLQKAYSTLPDLRTPQLELGFSVDLSWQSGHTYDINFE